VSMFGVYFRDEAICNVGEILWVTCIGSARLCFIPQIHLQPLGTWGSRRSLPGHCNFRGFQMRFASARSLGMGLPPDPRAWCNATIYSLHMHPASSLRMLMFPRFTTISNPMLVSLRTPFLLRRLVMTRALLVIAACLVLLSLTAASASGTFYIARSSV